MLAESEVPTGDRFLRLEGRPSEHLLPWITGGFGRPVPAGSVIAFISFAYADLPIGKAFTVAFRPSAPGIAEPCALQIAAVTQQFAKPFDSIPHGWKTICCLAFDGPPPSLITNLRVVEGWYVSPRSDHVLIATEESWRAYCAEPKREP